jgi:hypothetical protein
LKIKELLNSGIIGKLIRKEKSATFSFFAPATSPAVSVLPDLDTPGSIANP